MQNRDQSDKWWPRIDSSRKFTVPPPLRPVIEGDETFSVCMQSAASRLTMDVGMPLWKRTHTSLRAPFCPQTDTNLARKWHACEMGWKYRNSGKKAPRNIRMRMNIYISMRGWNKTNSIGYAQKYHWDGLIDNTRSSSDNSSKLFTR